MKTDSTAVKCENVHKEFGQGDSRATVLRGVDFDARLGEMTLLVGPSGSGKTTLLSVIAGLLDSTSGEVIVLGENVQRLYPQERILFRRKNLGFVFQQYNLLPALTAAENVAVPLLAAGIKRREAIDRSENLLRSLRMEKRIHALPNQLSGGEQQRVALARALIHEPRLIVCDEPTSALDASTGHAVMELLAEAAVRADRAVLVVTHDSRIFNFADRMSFMEDGRVVRTESKREAELQWSGEAPVRHESHRLRSVQ